MEKKDENEMKDWKGAAFFVKKRKKNYLPGSTNFIVRVICLVRKYTLGYN